MHELFANGQMFTEGSIGNAMEDRVTEIDLLKLLLVLKKKLWMIFIAGALGCMAAVALSIFFVKPTYKSTSQFYVFSSEATVSSLSELQAGSQLTKDYKVIIQSRPVLEDVIENLKLEIDYKQLRKKMRVENLNDTRIIEITVTDQDPERAKLIVNQIVDSSSKFIVGIMEMVEPKIIESGIIADEKSGPNVEKNGFQGAVLAIILMSGILIVIELYDDRLKDEEDVEKYLGLTVLASVPRKRKKVRSKLGK